MSNNFHSNLQVIHLLPSGNLPAFHNVLNLSFMRLAQLSPQTSALPLFLIPQACTETFQVGAVSLFYSATAHFCPQWCLVFSLCQGQECGAMGNAFIEKGGPKTVGQVAHCCLAWSTHYPYVMFTVLDRLAKTGITIMVVGIYFNISLHMSQPQC